MATDSTPLACDSDPSSLHSNNNTVHMKSNADAEHAHLEEQARHISAIMDGNIIHSPIPTNIKHAKMLDVGCGLGISTDFLGSQFPKAEVYGLDISPTRTHFRSKHLKNVIFLQGNIMSDKPGSWVRQDEADPTSPFTNAAYGDFDLVFSRFLLTSMTNWSAYIAKAHLLLKPNSGYIELHDLDLTWYDKNDEVISNSWKWLQAVRSAAAEDGLDLSCGTHIPEWLTDAGFEDVAVKKYKCPHGAISGQGDGEKAFGEYVAKSSADLVWQFLPSMLRRKGYSEEQIGLFKEEMLKCFEVDQAKYCVLSVVTGRRGKGSVKKVPDNAGTLYAIPALCHLM